MLRGWLGFDKKKLKHYSVMSERKWQILFVKFSSILFLLLPPAAIWGSHNFLASLFLTISILLSNIIYKQFCLCLLKRNRYNNLQNNVSSWSGKTPDPGRGLGNRWIRNLSSDRLDTFCFKLIALSLKIPRGTAAAALMLVEETLPHCGCTLDCKTVERVLMVYPLAWHLAL